MNTLKEIGAKFGIPVVKTFPGTVATMKALISDTRDSENIEGWVLRFNDGHMVKIKGDWYVRIHKTKDNLNFEKNVIDLIVNEKIDDAKSFMLDDDRHRVEKFEHEFWVGFAKTVARYQDYFDNVASRMDRKSWAQFHMPTVKQQNPFTPQVIFGMYDGKNAHNLVLDVIRKNLGTQTKVDAVRHLWGNAKWDYHFQKDS